MTTRLKFGLIDNALDYLLKAAEHARQDSPRDAKYALLHLSTGIELMLKARLNQEHWALLFANPDTATKQALESGDFVSVDAGLAIKRLCNISGCIIPNDDLRQLKSLRDQRNRVQHFAIDVEKAAVVSLITQSFDFSIRFIRGQMGGLLDEQGREQVGEVLRALAGFKDFVRVRLQAASTDIDKAKKLVGCPACWQETLELGGARNPKCHFCGFSDSIFAVASQAHHEEFPATRCPACLAPNALKCVLHDSVSRWLCYSCGEEGHYDYCFNNSCQNVLSDSDYCSDCAPEAANSSAND